MAEESYLQRLIARMGMPAAGPAPVGPAMVGVPEAASPPVFDPFAEAEIAGEAEVPTAAPPAPAAADPPQTQPISPEVRTGHADIVLAPADREIVREPQLPPIEPGAPMPLPSRPPVTQPDPPGPQSPAERPATAPLAMSQAAAVERTVLVPGEAPEPAIPPPAPAAAPATPPQELPPPAERVERVIREGLSPPLPEAAPAPVPEVLPAPTPPEPAARPGLPAPRIRIGEIRVEVVPPADPPPRGGEPPRTRVIGPGLPAPARPGVRSKRGFGLGQT